MRFRQVQIFIETKKRFWGYGHFKEFSSRPSANLIRARGSSSLSGFELVGTWCIFSIVYFLTIDNHYMTKTSNR